jgi:uncharacterized membrane protein (DUF4010 family)
MQDSVKNIPDSVLTSDAILESEDLFILVQKLLITIFIGALIGLEREHSKPEEEKTFAGIRTYPLISILGFSAALISSITTIWVYISVFVGYASLVTASYIFSAREKKHGGTSEITLLIIFLLGSLVYWNFLILAAVIGVIVTLFLTLKIQLHKFVEKVGAEDIYATVKLAIITIIILPLLPDQTYGPLNVLNPRLIWYMIIFISGISFVGYILMKVFGKNKGIALTGLMGGLVSSTAVSVSLSRESKKNKELSVNLAMGIILASTIMFPRIFFVTLILNSQLAVDLWIPLLIFTITGLLVSFLMAKKVPGQNQGSINLKNPFELKSALIFGLIFGVVIFLSKAAEVYIGTGGIYAASVLAGITSVDAIVLSLAKFSMEGLSRDVAAAAIIIAAITNTVVKAVITIVSGSKEIKRYTITGLGIITTISLLYLIFIFLK